MQDITRYICFVNLYMLESQQKSVISVSRR